LETARSGTLSSFKILFGGNDEHDASVENKAWTGACAVMRILMVSKSGVLAAHHGKLRELVKLGVDLTLIVPPRWGNQSLELTGTTDYEIRILPCWFTRYNHLHFYPARIGAIDADLVHLEEEPWSLVTYQFMRKCVKARKPVVFTTLQNILKKYPPPFDFFERYTFSHARGAIAGSDEIARILRSRGFKKPVTIAAYGIDPTVFVKRDASPLRRSLGLERAFIVGFIGRVIAAKGISELIRALALLPPTCVLLMVGSGGFLNEAKRLAESLGVSSRIRWIRQVESLQVPDYVNLLDVLVLPSRTTSRWKEQFGRVLIEAMACEKPPVGSSSGEIPNVIGDAGLIFPEGDVQALTERLRCLFENTDLRAELGIKGRARVMQNFTDRCIAEETLKLYRQVLTSSDCNSVEHEVRVGVA
jgi:glycosyltransferase involved in cell wall biosynthesis